MTDSMPDSAAARIRRLWSDRRVRLVVRAVALAWIAFFWLYLVGAQTTFDEVDAEAYWGLSLDTLYVDVQLGDQDAFLYSPVVAYLFLPFSALPFEVFYALLAAVNLAALVWILRPELAALSLFLVPVSNEVARGNIHILIALAIVLGFRYAGTWAWVLLTKVTPGIGLLWFAVRREWRPLAIALGLTGALVAVSFVITPDLWFRWFDVLTGSVTLTRPSVLEIPVLPRLGVAAVLVVVAGWRGWYWMVPVAATLALPAIWVNSLALLVAVVPLWRYSATRPAAPNEPATSPVTAAHATPGTSTSGSLSTVDRTHTAPGGWATSPVPAGHWYFHEGSPWHKPPTGTASSRSTA